MRDTLIFRFFVRLGSMGVFILPFLLGIFLVYSWFQSNFILPVDAKDKKMISFSVKGGDTLDSIKESLLKEGLIKNGLSLKPVSYTHLTLPTKRIV